MAEIVLNFDYTKGISSHAKTLAKRLSFLHEVDVNKVGNKWLMYELRPQYGDKILEVACGIGLDLVKTARLVGDRGMVVGLDYNEGLLSLGAKNTKKPQRISKRIKLLRADARELPFADNSFDKVFVVRGLHHIPSKIEFSNNRKPQEVGVPKKGGNISLFEMVRVLKPGGYIGAIEPNFGLLKLESDYPALSKRFAMAINKLHANGEIGAILKGIFSSLGVEDLKEWRSPMIIEKYSDADMLLDFKSMNQVITSTEMISEKEGQFLIDNLRKKGLSRGFQLILPLFGVVGMKPHVY